MYLMSSFDSARLVLPCAILAKLFRAEKASANAPVSHIELVAVHISEPLELWYEVAMNREAAINELAARADALRARGVAAAYLFGSTARNEARPGSDLDVFVDIVPGAKFSLLDMIGAQHFLEDELAVKVDLVTRNGLLPDLRDDIERDAIQVF